MNEARNRRDGADVRRSAMRSRIGVAAAVLAIATLVWLGIRNAMPSLPSSPATTDRVAVLPFDNRTGDRSLDALGIVTADRITTALQTGGHAVVPSIDAVRAAMRLGGDEAARSEIEYATAVATETGARIVVTGEIVLSGDSLGFLSRLTDARGALDLDAPDQTMAPAAAPVPGIEALRERVSKALATRRGEGVRSDTVAPAAPELAAYMAFAQGLQHEARNDWRGALERFHASHAQDPTATVSLVHAALCHLRLGEYASADSVARMAQRDSSRLTDPDRAWLRYVASFARGEADEALRATGRVWEFAPASFVAWDLARTALLTNRPRIAWNTLLDVDPDVGAMRGWYPYWTVMAESLHRMGEHDRELVAARRAGELHPDERGTAYLEAAALAALGRLDELERVIGEAVRTGGHAVRSGTLMHMAAGELRAHDEPAAADSMLLRALAWSDAVADSIDASAPHLLLRARILEDLGRIDEAARVVEGLARIEEVASDVDDPGRTGAVSGAAELTSGGTAIGRTGWLGRLAAQRGDTATAMAAVRTLADHDEPYSFGASLVERARIIGRLGDADGAIELLREARTRGWALPRHPDVVFPELASRPAFARLIQPPD